MNLKYCPNSTPKVTQNAIGKQNLFYPLLGSLLLHGVWVVGLHFQEKPVNKTPVFTSWIIEHKETSPGMREVWAPYGKGTGFKTPFLKRSSGKTAKVSPTPPGRKTPQEKRITPQLSSANTLFEISNRIENHLEYPLSLRRKKIKGRVVLKLTLSSSGSLKLSEIIQPSGNSDLDRLALEAASRASPFPLILNKEGTPVIAPLIVQINFKMI